MPTVSVGLWFGVLVSHPSRVLLLRCFPIMIRSMDRLLRIILRGLWSSLYRCFDVSMLFLTVDVCCLCRHMVRCFAFSLLQCFRVYDLIRGPASTCYFERLVVLCLSLLQCFRVIVSRRCLFILSIRGSVFWFLVRVGYLCFNTFMLWLTFVGWSFRPLCGEKVV